MSLIVVLIVSAVPALALLPAGQHHGPPPSPAQHNAPPPSAAPRTGPVTGPNPNGSSFQPKGPGPHRGDWLRKYMTLPPHQQEQQLQSDPAFRSLPPDRQNHLLDRLRKFNSQSPEK